MDWRERCDNKLISAQEALKAVRNGDTVQVNWLHATPVTLSEALMARKDELRDVKVCTIGPIFNWAQPGADRAFILQTPYLGVTTRPPMTEGRVEFIPVMYYRYQELPPGMECDVYLTPVSPPDKHGYCSFGTGLFMSKTMTAAARVVIAEDMKILYALAVKITSMCLRSPISSSRQCRRQPYRRPRESRKKWQQQKLFAPWLLTN